MKTKLLGVMLAASMLKSSLVDADHLPRLQEKIDTSEASDDEGNG